MLLDLLCLSIIIILAIIALLALSYHTIKPYEEGLLIVLGNYRRKLLPGSHFVPPIISSVVKINTIPQNIEILLEEYISKDNNIFNINAIGRIIVMDSEKAYFKVQNYQMDTIRLVQKVMKSLISEMSYKEILHEYQKLETRLKYKVNYDSKIWGVKLEEIKLDKIELISKGKKGRVIVNKRNLEIEMRDILTKFTEKFGITIEKVEIIKYRGVN